MCRSKIRLLATRALCINSKVDAAVKHRKTSSALKVYNKQQDGIQFLRPQLLERVFWGGFTRVIYCCNCKEKLRMGGFLGFWSSGLSLFNGTRKNNYSWEMRLIKWIHLCLALTSLGMVATCGAESFKDCLESDLEEKTGAAAGEARLAPSVWRFITDPNNSAFFAIRLAFEVRIPSVESWSQGEGGGVGHHCV